MIPLSMPGYIGSSRIKYLLISQLISQVLQLHWPDMWLLEQYKNKEKKKNIDLF